MNTDSDDQGISSNWATLQGGLQAHHKKLADKFHGLSLAMAYGAVFLLMELEQMFPPEDSDAVLSLHIAWVATTGACLFGSVHLLLEMILPLRVKGLVEHIPSLDHTWTRERILDHLEDRIDRYLWHGIPLFAHMVCLAAVFLCVVIYRF